MIAKAPGNGKRGSNTYGLLRYLFGPGRANEHRDQHVVAAWDPAWLHDDVVAPRPRGWLARLGREVDAAMTGHQVQVSGGHAYHVVLSVPQVDGALGDERWRPLAEDAVARMGLGPDAEGRGGCRWVAVHHGLSKEGNDHVHLVMNLVRGDGRIADTYRDWPRWRQWCLDVERRYDLTPTSPANKTAPRRPTRGETEKAVRLGLPVSSREYLRDVVRQAVVGSGSAEDFVELLTQQLGVACVKARWDDAHRLTGYRVARMGDPTSRPDGRVWFTGSQLARDLSAPKLTQRWAAVQQGPSDRSHHVGGSGLAERLTTLERAAEAALRARDALAPEVRTTSSHSRTDPDQTDLVDGVAHATLDLLVATAKCADRFDPRSLIDVGPLTTAAHAYERAAMSPYRVQPSVWAPVAVELRLAARQLIRAGALTKSGRTGVAVVALIVALAALVAEVAAWREQNQQLPQAVAARQSARLLNEDAAARQARVVTPRSIRSGSMPRQPPTLIDRRNPSADQPLPRRPRPQSR